ncbi:hypothetical protein GGR52DRAFT_549092 [Hypoxylon sp. FL1284]|nr:hypothetical protein GGR52DRAFT_549092 [Hypoxylon sp. FL1284]
MYTYVSQDFGRGGGKRRATGQGGGGKRGGRGRGRGQGGRGERDGQGELAPDVTILLPDGGSATSPVAAELPAGSIITIHHHTVVLLGSGPTRLPPGLSTFAAGSQLSLPGGNIDAPFGADIVVPGMGGQGVDLRVHDLATSPGTIIRVGELGAEPATGGRELPAALRLTARWAIPARG